MRKIQIKREYFGVHYHNDCAFCGLNTNLLAESEKILVDSKIYCKSCYQKGIDKKSVTPKDFYRIPYENYAEKEPLAKIAKESICSKLPRLEIAHLCGEYGEEGCICLDLYPIAQESRLYFRLSLCDDDDPWFGTEVYHYISPEQATKLLNLNGIHILDGLTDDNWMHYFDFL